MKRNSPQAKRSSLKRASSPALPRNAAQPILRKKTLETKKPIKSGEFKNQYRDELVQILDLNRIIDVAEFNDAKTLIERNFRLYL